jgi:hypothetical protein
MCSVLSGGEVEREMCKLREGGWEYYSRAGGPLSD